MKLLLDTHTFLWFIQGNFNLSDAARDLIENPENERFLSVASLWEMAIKVSIGKLALEMTLTELVSSQIYDNAIKLLGIQPEHLDELSKLPFHHKDPFDRLIIAQSLAEKIPIVTKDSAFGGYSITILW